VRALELSTVVRRGALLVLVALAAVVPAACGGGGVTSTLDPVAAAATKTQQAGGVKLDLAVSTTVGGQTITVTGHGAFEHDQGSLDFDFGGLPGLNAGGSATRIVYLTEDGGAVIYMHTPLLDGRLPGGKSWIRFDLQKAGKALGVNVQQLMAGASQNPSDALHLLESNGSFDAVGHETIDGADTTHYHGTVDLAAAAKASGAPDDLVQRLLDSGAPAQFPVDVWIDGSGYVRQVKENLPQGSSGSPAVQMTVGLSDYGTSVDVSAPPAAEVYDATDAATKSVESSTTTG